MARKQNNRKTRGTGKTTFSIIVDGQTEVWYFQMMKKNENLPRIDIKPELPKKKKLKEQYETVLKYSCQYDKLIWLLDFDTIIKEDQEKRKGEESKILIFKKYLSKLSGISNVEVYVNTPCLEYWLLLHYSNTGKFFGVCENAEKELKKSYLTNYQKSEKFYKKKDRDIYKILKDNQSLAISNAKLLGDFDIEKPKTGKAEIYKILETFGIS